MKYAIFGDIHGNLDALDAVIPAMAEHAPDRRICVGDIVGYGAEPNSCIRRVREVSDLIVAGNHDCAATNALSIEQFNPFAAEALRWTRAKLTNDECAFLSSLPLTAQEDDFLVVHATPDDPEAFGYIQTLYHAQRSFEALQLPLCFVGHSHIPVSFFLEGDQISYTMDPVIRLREADKSLINVGSVGQPRDFDPRASFGIYDSERQVVTIYRVTYDVERACHRIKAAGLPAFLAERLMDGR